MELREWLIILGLALVSLIVIDGIRRFKRQRNIPRLDAELDAEEAAETSLDPEAQKRAAQLDWELPSGGARVIKPAKRATVIEKPELQPQEHPGPSKVLSAFKQEFRQNKSHDQAASQGTGAPGTDADGMGMKSTDQVGTDQAETSMYRSVQGSGKQAQTKQETHQESSEQETPEKAQSAAVRPIDQDGLQETGLGGKQEPSLEGESSATPADAFSLSDRTSTQDRIRHASVSPAPDDVIKEPSSTPTPPGRDEPTLTMPKPSVAPSPCQPAPEADTPSVSIKANEPASLETASPHGAADASPADAAPRTDGQKAGTELDTTEHTLGNTPGHRHATPSSAPRRRLLHPRTVGSTSSPSSSIGDKTGDAAVNTTAEPLASAPAANKQVPDEQASDQGPMSTEPFDEDEGDERSFQLVDFDALRQSIGDSMRTRKARLQTLRRQRAEKVADKAKLKEARKAEKQRLQDIERLEREQAQREREAALEDAAALHRKRQQDARQQQASAAQQGQPQERIERPATSAAFHDAPPLDDQPLVDEWNGEFSDACEAPPEPCATYSQAPFEPEPHPVLEKACRHEVSGKLAQQALSQAEDVIVITVMSRDEEGFQASRLLELIMACGLRYSSKMGVFHRFETESAKSPLQFSAVNVTQPGTFPLEEGVDFNTPGITFLMPLPSAMDSSVAFEAMVETAMVVVRHLGGELKDEHHSVMTLQTIEFARQRVHEFERRHRLQRHRQAR